MIRYFYNLLKSNNEDPPLAHAVARMLMVMGVKDIPIFDDPVISLEIFEDNQRDLEIAVEKLCSYLEQEDHCMDIMYMKNYIQRLWQDRSNDVNWQTEPDLHTKVEFKIFAEQEIQNI